MLIGKLYNDANTAWSEYLGLTRKQVQKDIKELQEAGFLSREGSSRSGRWIVKK
jgi:predicted HTH transcriptional regulator